MAVQAAQQSVAARLLQVQEGVSSQTALGRGGYQADSLPEVPEGGSVMSTRPLPEAYGHQPWLSPRKEFPNLDAWLEAHRKGRLERSPVREPDAYMVMLCARNANTITEEQATVFFGRLRQWRKQRSVLPRLCRHCRVEFCPPDGRIKTRCPACIQAGGRS
jgi:hypothetical protein